MLGDFCLDPKQIFSGQLTIKRLGPNVIISVGPDQLHINADGVSRSLH